MNIEWWMPIFKNQANFSDLLSIKIVLSEKIHVLYQVYQLVSATPLTSNRVKLQNSLRFLEHSGYDHSISLGRCTLLIGGSLLLAI